MKRAIILLLATALLAGSATFAFATDINVKGRFDFGFGLYKGTTFTKHDGQDNFDVKQRLRTQINFIASDALKGTAFFEIGPLNWGSGGGATWGFGNAASRKAGGAMGADGVNVKVRHMYIDWTVPETDINVRMGIQPFALPKAVMRGGGGDSGYVLDDDLAGILLSTDFNENYGLTLSWLRPWNPFVYGEAPERSDPQWAFRNNDEIDVFNLTLPIEYKSKFQLTPYFSFASVGEYNTKADFYSDPALDYRNYSIGSWLSANGSLGDNGKAWWAGLAFDFSWLDPFVAAFDFTYGSYTADDRDSHFQSWNNTKTDRSGWVGVAKFGYRLDYFTPIVFGWYGSGTDSLYKDGYDGLMPYLSPDWGLSSLGWSNAAFGGREYLIGATPTGTWAVGVGLENISIIDKLTSQFRVLYFEGTNNVDVPKNLNWHHDAFRTLGVMDKKDHGIEVNLDSVYSIYDNLNLAVEFAYMNISLADEPANFERNAWKGLIAITYTF